MIKNYFKLLVTVTVIMLSSATFAHADITSNLSAYWSFEEGSGSSAADSSGNEYNATLNGSNGLPIWTTGPFNGALYFDGSDDSVRSLYMKTSGNGTVVAWFKAGPQTSNASTVIRPIVKQGTLDGAGSVTPEGISISMNRTGSTHAGKLTFTWGSDGSTARSTLTYNDNQWHMVAMTHTGTTLVGYVDGQQVVTATSSDIVSTSHAFMIGGSTQQSAQKFLGHIDDVRVYERTLSASDILELYTVGYRPTMTTTAATSVGTSTVTLNGTTDNEKVASSTARGFVYGTTTAYGATTTEAGTFGRGSFSAGVTGLADGTTYHFRAYASNGTSTGYGNDQTFTTDPDSPVSVPTVTTLNPSSITTSSFVLNGSITDTGGSDAMQAGFAYGTTSDLSTGVSTTTLGAQSGAASLSQTITGLSLNTTYYFRSYAVNFAGTSTGSINSTTTLAAHVPGAPTGLQASAEDAEVFLTWSPPALDGGSSITDYVLEYKPTASSTYLTFDDGVSVSTARSITGLTNDVSYDFRVSAVNALGTSSPSSSTTTTPFLSLFERSNPFVSGEDGYDTFRIPAVTVAPNGDILAFAEGRVNSDNDFGDIDIVMKRSTDEGDTWGSLSVVAENSTLLAGNPGIMVDYLDPAYPEGRIFLFHMTANQSVPTLLTGTGVKETWFRVSTDNGYTWGTPTNITTSVSRPNEPSFNPAYDFAEDWKTSSTLPGSAIQLQKAPYRGRIVVGDKYATSSNGIYVGFAFYSDDHGATWTMGSGNTGMHTHENQIVELSDGRLMMNSRRTDDSHLRGVSYSSDGGDTWTPTVNDPNLIDPEVQGSIHRYTLADFHGQNRLLFVNPASTVARANLSVKLSMDEGVSWPVSRTIDSGAFTAYSDIAVLRDGTVGVLYEYGTSVNDYRGLYFAKFNLNWIAGSSTSTIEYFPLLTTELEADKATASSGDVVTYTATITNATSSLAYGLPTSGAANSIDYEVTIPSYLKFVSNSLSISTPSVSNTTIVSGNSPSDDSVHVILDSLDPAETYRLSYQVRVVGAEVGTTLVSYATTTASNWDRNRDGAVSTLDALTDTSEPLEVVQRGEDSQSSSASSNSNASSRSRSSSAQRLQASSQRAVSTATNRPSVKLVRDLTSGSSGDDVAEVQKFLIAQGYLLPGNATGYFGTLTRAALASYQKSMGIFPSVGNLGPLTRAALNQTALSSVPVRPMPSISSFSRDLTLGSRGDDVRLIQKFLNSQNFIVSPTGVGSFGLESDYFGPQTQRALMQFQLYYGITPAQGYLGPKTREAILRFSTSTQ